VTLRKEICASLLLLAAAIIHAPGQTNMAESASMDWVVRNWQTKDGLPQNTPYAITQTPDGYLWVGTSGGLARPWFNRRPTGAGSLAAKGPGCLSTGIHSGSPAAWRRARAGAILRQMG
jgi:ligand-binding sensor domain-containing protein